MFERTKLVAYMQQIYAEQTTTLPRTQVSTHFVRIQQDYVTLILAHSF